MERFYVHGKNSCSNDSVDFRLVDEIHCKIQQANNCLLLRHFEDSLDICQKNIAIARNYTENDRARASLEALVAIAVQAYAELNRWREVVPFVAQTYNGIEDCPSLIAHLCLSLHAHLQDSVTCSVIANIWLKNPANCPVNGYRSLAEMYIVKVLCTCRRWDDVRPFLDSCPGLSESARDSMVQKVAAYRRKLEQEEGDCIEVLESRSTDSDKTDHSTSVSALGQIHAISDWLPHWMQRLLWYAKRQLQQNAPYVSLGIVRNTCVVLIIFYLVISRWRRGLLKSAIVTRVISVLSSLWRGMFAPLYMVSGQVSRLDTVTTDVQQQ